MRIRQGSERRQRGSVWATWLAFVAVGCADGPSPRTVVDPTAAPSGAGPAAPAANSAGVGAPGSGPPTASPNGPAAPSGDNPALPTPTTEQAELPCDVADVVSAKCARCHGAMPIGGAPMPLVTHADFSASITSQRTQPGSVVAVSELVKRRVNDVAMPMPPGALLPVAERAVLNGWLDRGNPRGAASEARCAVTSPMQPSTLTPGVPKPDGTTCYTFRNHGQPSPGDTTPYPIAPGEQYVSFFYTAPWAEPSELVSWRTLYDNQQVLHHWLFYTTIGADMDGTFAPAIGTHIGDAAQLIAGWAVGGNDTQMPENVGLRLPPPGSGLLVEWHFYNTSGVPTTDSSALEFCVVPAGSLEHTAGITWLGTENFNGLLGMPAHAESQFSGTCRPSRTGMNATDPIRIFSFWPHMHTYGRHMRSVVTRANGTQEEVFNRPFDFNFQISYDAEVELQPGDTITSTCTFMNTSDAPVAFGPSTTQEMCYQFAFSYPAAALDNGIPSLVGATNTCW